MFSRIHLPITRRPDARFALCGARHTLFIATLGLLFAACGGGGGGGSGGGNPLSGIVDGGGDDGGTVATCSTPPAANGSVTVSGAVTYDRVPATSGSVGLDYDATVAMPVRGAVIQALACDLSVIAATVTDAGGNYSLVVGGEVPVMIRVRAQLSSTSGATWDVKVLDNTSGNALYVLDGKMQNTTTQNETRNLHASSGWGGSSYSETRAAAPFAILDSIYGAMARVAAVNSTVAFPALNIFWSKNNQLSDNDFDTAGGLLPASFFDGNAIYLLGKENQDTDEYDDHVILHEWGHYIQYRFSRDDSLGGAHADISHLDPRVAFSEGFGNAWSAIMTDDPLYVDTDSLRQSSGFDFNIETDSIPGFAGWFKEFSVQQIIYDIYDANNEGADGATLGLGPIWQALTSGMSDSDALVTLFVFITDLKNIAPTAADEIDDLTSAQNIDPVADIYGSGEDNWADLDASFPADEGNLAVYETLSLNSAQNVCTSGTYGAYNGFGVYRYLRFTAASAGNYRVDVDALGDGSAQPAVAIWRRGALVGESTAPVTRQLSAGNYVVEVFDARNIQGDPLGDAGVINTNIDVCFSVTVTTP